MKGILGKKLGMTQVFDDQGNSVPVTVIEAGPCVVVETKTKASHGYQALKLGFGAVAERKLSRPYKGIFGKRQLTPSRYLRELDFDDPSAYQVGQVIDVSIFEAGEIVDVVGTTKGKGFAGGMKRHKFHGGPASHGSMVHRRPSSAGDTNAARVVKGSRRPGHMGDKRCTSQGLKVVRVDTARNLLLVRGTVPGGPNGLLLVKSSSKH